MAARFSYATGNRLTQTLPFTDLSNITLMFWFILHSSSAARADLMCYGYDDGVASGDGFELGTPLGGAVIYISEGGVVLTRGTGYTAVIGRRYSIAVTRKASGNWIMYIDGKFYESMTAGPATPAIAPVLTIGSPLGNVPACDSSIGPFMVWKYALEAGQILDVHQFGKLKGAELETASRYFNLDETTLLPDQAKSATRLAVTGTVSLAPSLPQVEKILSEIRFKRPGTIIRAALTHYDSKMPEVARDFSGSTSNYLTVGDVPALDILGDQLTLHAWIITNTLSGNPTIISKWNQGGGQQQYTFALLSGSIFGGIGDGVGGGDFVTGSALTVGRLYNAVLRKAGTGTGSLQIFLDGSQVGVTNSTRVMTNTTAGFHIGRLDNAVEPWNGKISHPAVWDAALNNTEIEQLARGVSPRLIRPGSLKGYWPMVEYPSARDYSPYNNPATLVGTVPSIPFPQPVIERQFSVGIGEALLAAVPYVTRVASY
jgi:hypothetical protein